MVCQVCEELRDDEDNPDLICGYCKSAVKRAARLDPCAHAKIKELANSLDCPELASIANIVKIAEQVGAQKLDSAILEIAIEKFRNKASTKAVTLNADDWEFLIQNFPTDRKISRSHILRAKILEQLR